MPSDKSRSTLNFDKDQATPDTGRHDDTVRPVFNGAVGSHIKYDTIEGGFTITPRKRDKS